MRKIILLGLLFITKFTYSQTDTTSKILNDCVVTGTRSVENQPITQKTISISEITTSLQGQDIPVFISKTPSITYYTDGGNPNGYMYYRLRGLDQTRINTTLNGVPLNEPEDQGAYFSNYPDFLSNINSVQIIRGVGTTTNGVSSYAGSMNFESPNLLSDKFTNIQLTYGSFNTKRLSTSFNTGILDNKFAFYGRYSNLSSDGYRNHSGTQGNTFYFSGGYFQNRYSFKFTSFYGQSKNDMSYLASDINDIESNRRHNPLTNNEKDQFNQNVNILSYNFYVNKYETFSTTIFYNQLSGNYDVLFGDMYNYQLKSNHSGILINYLIDRGNLRLSNGISTSYYERNHSMGIKPYEQSHMYSNTGYKKELSAYIKVTYRIGKFIPYFDIQERFVKFNYSPSSNSGITSRENQWSFFNPKIGYTYNITKSISTYGFVGQSWREPTRNDMFAGFDDMDQSNVSMIGNLDRVKPETVIDYEAGITYTKPIINITINYFDMNFKNEIAPIGQLSYIGLPLRKNISSSRRNGLELDVTIKPIKNFNIGGNITFMKSNISSYTTDYDATSNTDTTSYKNVSPLLTPNIITNGFISYKFKQIYIELNSRYISDSYLDNTNNTSRKLPKSLVFNTIVNIKMSKTLTTIITINNIFSSNYYNSGYVNMNTMKNAYFVSPFINGFITFNFNF